MSAPVSLRKDERAAELPFRGSQLVEKPCLKEKSPFLQGEYEGETGEAPPAAEKASRFRGSGAIGGPEGAGNRKAA
ncbi:MAG: hypothetical protein MSF32_07245, partial [Dysosmobacter sp.]|nr:hypothetical protein [Dysosmobacter sp.]